MIAARAQQWLDDNVDDADEAVVAIDGYVTLPPGAYTAIVQGVNNGTGVAVIGVYKVN